MSTALPPALDRTTVAARLTDARCWLSRHEMALWTVAILALVADVALTNYGLANGLVERNPVARTAFAQHGVAALAALKLAALAVAAVGRTALPDRYGAVVPLGLAVPWVLATGVNAVVIVVAT